MPTQNRATAAAARRRLRELKHPVPDPARTQEIATALTTYSPQAIDPDTWQRIRPTVAEVLTRSAVTRPESIRKHLTHLSHFYAWATAHGLRPDAGTLSRANLETYIATGMSGSSPKSRADRRARLRPIADGLHPDQGTPAGPVIARPAVRPPYSASEMAAILRAAQTQPTQVQRRTVGICVGLGAGAGLSPADFRDLRRRHVEDHGPDGLSVTVPHGAVRTVPVLRRYEHLVRAATEGIGVDDLLLGGAADRKNLTGRAFEDAVLLGDCPRIEQSRLRHTWLADMLAAHVPLQLLLQAAGLRSARTLTDLLPCLPVLPGTATALLRDPEVVR